MEPIIINTTINSPVEKIWEFYNSPKHIVNWNFAHESWECPKSVINFEVGGEFFNTMSAKDKSASFVFQGTYTEIIPLKKIVYFIEDGRKVEVFFNEIDENTSEIFIRFEPEMINSLEIQEQGWQSILDNFKKYCEN